MWLFLFGVVTQNFGHTVGIPYLFLDPEYKNKVDFLSLLILGLSIGGFAMAFHITCYILDCNRFTFLGTLPKPFLIFCFNNSVLPAVFVIVYLYNFFNFQFSSGFQSYPEIFVEAIGFMLGYFTFQLLVIFYFQLTNTDILKVIAKGLDNTLMRNRISRVNVIKRNRNSKKTKHRVNSYMTFPFFVHEVDHHVVRTHAKEHITKVFDQNHMNAVILEVFALLSVAVMSIFEENPSFQIPAAASGMLFCSIFMMFTGALSYWLRGWAISSVILLAFLINILTTNGIIDTKFPVYGLEYNKKISDYSYQRLTDLSSDSNYTSDKARTIQLLNNWRNKFPQDKKPKMVLVCTSGGGQRAAVWTVRSLQYIDSVLKDGLMQHSVLFTGASGGCVGAAYYRELYLQKLNKPELNITNKLYFDNMAKDILNPVIFSYVVNDFLIRFRTFTYKGKTYSVDRGHAFEQQLNKNTGGILDKTLFQYRTPEFEGRIPMLLLSPTVVNDGRKLYVSAQDVSYMNTATLAYKSQLNERLKGIEFRRFYKDQDADSLRFLSGLRMNATFPYVTPNVILPSSPAMEIMDAGLSDNFGIGDAVRFMFTFQDWIKENTSGVVVISIRDSDKEFPIEKLKGQSIFQKMFNPIGSLYNNWDYVQDVHNDNILEYAKATFGEHLNCLEFKYIPKPRQWTLLLEKNIDPEKIEKKNSQERAVLSWHLTKREKESLFRTIYEDNNRESLLKLQTLLNNP
jgi:rhodanese-related sulfurtransferase